MRKTLTSERLKDLPTLSTESQCKELDRILSTLSRVKARDISDKELNAVPEDYGMVFTRYSVAQEALSAGGWALIISILTAVAGLIIKIIGTDTGSSGGNGGNNSGMSKKDKKAVKESKSVLKRNQELEEKIAELAKSIPETKAGLFKEGNLRKQYDKLKKKATNDEKAKAKLEKVDGLIKDWDEFIESIKVPSTEALTLLTYIVGRTNQIGEIDHLTDEVLDGLAGAENKFEYGYKNAMKLLKADFLDTQVDNKTLVSSIQEIDTIMFMKVTSPKHLLDFNSANEIIDFITNKALTEGHELAGKSEILAKTLNEVLLSVQSIKAKSESLSKLIKDGDKTAEQNNEQVNEQSKEVKAALSEDVQKKIANLTQAIQTTANVLSKASVVIKDLQTAVEQNLEKIQTTLQTFEDATITA